MKLHGGKGCLVCALTLALGCAQAHSRRERRDQDDLETEPSSVETEPSTVADPGESSPVASNDAATSDDAEDSRDAEAPDSIEREAGAAEAAAPEPDLTLQVFDPEQVYLLGEANGGLCETAVAAAGDLRRLIVGFGCTSFGTVQVRPSDGRLLYSAYPGGLRVFSCDGCVPHASGAPYPSEPESNDERIPSPCTGDAADFPEFRVLPDGGVFHRCGEQWRDQGARAVASSAPFSFGFGNANTALREDGVFDLSEARLYPFVGLPDHARRTYRVRPDGYWLVLGERGSEELWHVAFDGGARRVGAYAAPPAGQQLLSGSKLDGQGRLYEIGRDVASARSAIVRRSPDGTSEVIDVEPGATSRWQRVFFLFTGP